MDLTTLEHKAEHASRLLKAISNDKRLLILCALNRGEKNVGELEKLIGLSQSALSQHLARLRRDGLVSTRREAQTIYYSINNAELKAILKTLAEIYGCDKDWSCNGDAP